MKNPPPVLELVKDIERARVKMNIPELPPIAVNLAIDGSGSMYNLFGQGYVDRAVSEFCAFAKEFDDDGVLPYGLFSDVWNGRKEVRFDDFDDPKYRYDNPSSGGTSYMRAVEGLWLNEHPYLRPKGGILGALISAVARSAESTTKAPNTYIAFITDGKADDRREFDQWATRLQPNVFLQLIVIGQDVPTDYFANIGRKNNDVAFISDPTTINSEEFFCRLFNEKFASWARTLTH